MSAALARSRHRRAAVFAVLMLATIGAFFLTSSGGALIGVLILYFIFFAAFHTYLGMTARAMGRSWVYFGLLPVLWPVMGGLIAFAVLHFALRKVATQSPNAPLSPQ